MHSGVVVIDTPKFPDSSVKVPPGSISPRVAGHGAGFIHQVKPDSLINAEVTKHDISGNPILRTSAGDITISSKLPLQNGSNIVLKVLVNSQLHISRPDSQLPFNFQAQIVTIDGKAPSTPATPQAGQPHNIVTGIAFSISNQSSKLADPALQGSVSQSATSVITSATISSTSSMATRPDAAIVNVSNGVILDSVVVNPNNNAGRFLPAQTNNLQPVDNVVLHVLRVNLPQPQSANPASVEQNTTQLAQTSTAASQTPPQTATPSGAAQTQNPASTQSSQISTVSEPVIKNPSLGNLPSGSSISVQNNLPYKTTPLPPPILPGQEGLVGKQPANIPTETTALTSNKTFTGTVVGTERSGEIVLKTPLGTLKLAPDVSLPRDTQLTLEVIKVTGAQAEPIRSDSVNGFSLEKMMIEQKNLMTQLVLTAATLGQDVVNAVSARIPANDAQMVAKLLWFLAGIRKGDEKFWLGKELTRKLEQENKTDLLKRMQSHFAGLSKGMKGLPNSKWNLFLFPFFDGEELQNGTMFTRHYGEEETEDKEQEGTRFVVELDLSMIGEMQLDGFIKEFQRGKELDIFMRTKKPIDNQMESDIREIFIASIEIMGINGNIQFQVAEGFPSNPSEELGEDEHMGSIMA